MRTTILIMICVSALSCPPWMAAEITPKVADSLQAVRPAISDSEAVPDTGTFIPFEVAPQPLPEASPQPKFPDRAKGEGIEILRTILSSRCSRLTA